MTIKITKHKDTYTAIVTGFGGKEVWRTSGPMDEKTLRDTLHELGHHQIDVTEAFLASDPERKRKFHEANKRELIERVGPEEAKRITEKYEERLKKWTKTLE